MVSGVTIGSFVLRGFVLLVAVGCGGRVAASGAEDERELTGAELAPRVALVGPSVSGDGAEALAGVSLLPRTAVDLARSAAEASPPAAPSPAATCACASVAVSCSGPAAGYASSDRAACRMALSRETCMESGLVTDASVETATLLALPTPSASSTPSELYAHCAVVHEARHVCDGPELRACETEQRAYDTSVTCFRAFEAAHCEGADAPPVCAWVARYAEASERARDLNACLCQPSSTCTSCASACAAGQGADLRDFCRVAAAAYCPAAGKGRGP